MKVCDMDVSVKGRLIRVARLAAEGYEVVEDPAAMVEGLRASGERIDVFTFVQDIAETIPKYGYLMEAENAAAVPISTFEHWWKRQTTDKVRNHVRRAEKQGVVVRRVLFDDDLVRGISAIYDETPMRQGRAFWHYGKGLEVVRQENGTFRDRSVFLGAFYRDELIGFAKLVFSRSQAGLMQIVAMIRHRDKCASNALIAEAVRACAERQVPYLVYSKFTYGKKQHDSLADFKRANGFQRIELPRYWVPLTLIGRVGLRFGLHREVVTYVPEVALSQLRRARAVWSARRLQAAKEVA
jgi:hypothetical protein